MVLFTAVLLCNGSITMGQQVKKDSLTISIQKQTTLLSNYIALADILSTQNFDSAILISRLGMPIALTKKDSIAYGVLIGKIAKAQYFKGNYDSAAFYYYQAANILQRLPKAGIAFAYLLNDWARLYRKTKDYEQALLKYDVALQIFRKQGDSTGVSTILNESGVVFEYQQNYTEAIRRYQASLVIARQQKDSVGIGYALSFIAGVYLLQNRYSEAEKYNLEALQIRKLLKDSFSIALSYADLGTMYQSAKQLVKSVENFTLSNQIAEKIGYMELLSTNYANLASLYKGQGNYQKAYWFIQKHNQLKDSIYQVAKTKSIQELSTKYETARTKATVAEQSLAIQKKNYWIAGLIGFLFFAVLLGLSFYRRYKLKKEKQLQEAIFKQQELATKAILEAEENERKRIASDLHDGVGQLMSAAKMNLSAIEAEIPFANAEQKKAYEKAQQLVDESCKEVRTVSHNMMPNALLKASLASAVREFINQIDTKVIKVDLYTEGLNERIDANVETVLYRVVQECVNNVIKHAAANHLDISLIKDVDGLSATIEDNGKGFDASDKTKYDGIGLKNIKTRIAYLKGTVEWNAQPNKGTVVAIHVPLNNNTALIK